MEMISDADFVKLVENALFGLFSVLLGKLFGTDRFADH